MDAKLQGYIDKLNKLNFKEMYENDFFLTWEKTDDEIDAVFTVADALRYMRENNISTKGLSPGLASACSVTIPHARASALLRPAICSASKYRIWMRRRARSPMARRYVKLPI